MLKNEMFVEDVIESLPDDALEGVKKLIQGYISYVENRNFEPLTNFDQCRDGYALISSYNKAYNLGLPLSEVNSDDKGQIIKTLNSSIVQLHEILNVSSVNQI